MAETRTALVTGGNRGIGLEISRQLARLGVLTAIGSRDKAKGEAAASELRAEGLEPAVVELDVTSSESVQAAVAQTCHLFGRIDILVNNAGVLEGSAAAGGATNVANVPIEEVLSTLDANTVGPLRMIQAVLPFMQKEDYGRIVNISSTLGQLAEMGGGYTSYRLSKTALNALTRTAAGDIGPGNIKVNSMCPGWVRTDMGGPNATRSVTEGAETAIWLATLEDDGPTGGFFRDKKPIGW
ncbi:MAG: short-chain dehydrogenase [Alphaproteobacteria bacterium BRH_c36]|nr:MAG: short-chain dehydrogenase [Alphaproteobacteria bacterium BRH_c36]